MKSRLPMFALILLALLGVVLPVVTLSFECVTHLCAQELFDPIPTFWHFLLVAFVPVTNAYTLWVLRRGEVGRLKLVAFANAAVIGVATFYTLLLAPVLPLAIIALIVYLLGLLPLTPLLSLVAAVVSRLYLRRMAREHETQLPRVVYPLLAILLVMLATEVKPALSDYHMGKAAEGTTAERARSIAWLRTSADKDVLLRACYGRSRTAGKLVLKLFGVHADVSFNDAREIYYRVTGQPFNSVQPPASWFQRSWMDDFEFDPDQGGQQVAGKVKGLSLQGSRIEGSIDAEAAVGYVEWTLLFMNVSDRQREARAQIVLPPGSVVSRATLWVAGEEREAAFAGKKQVREAYEKVVRTRRDPLLVTTSGPDRVLVQCFPVQPGEQMKIRIGITAPLQVESADRALLRLPSLQERNFSIDSELRHELLLEAATPLEGSVAALRTERTEAAHALLGDLTDAELWGAGGFVTAGRAGKEIEILGNDPVAANAAVRQRIEARPATAPTRVLLVVDGSTGMRDHAAKIADAIAALPGHIELGAIVASDAPIVLAEPATGTSGVIAERLRKLSFEGGCDNSLALWRAHDWASRNAISAIVWVHGPQPVRVVHGHDESARDRTEPLQDAVPIYDLQLEQGPNVLVEILQPFYTFRTVPRSGSAAADLTRLFASWGGQTFEPLREHVTQPATPSSMRANSGHLARLWAFGEVNRLLARRDGKGRDEALKIAASYRLVTPVSGAVVLETEQQYEDAGLRPANADSVPSIPEPETWLLAAVALAALVWAMRRRKPTCTPA